MSDLYYGQVVGTYSTISNPILIDRVNRLSWISHLTPELAQESGTISLTNARN